jgi:hypothetical protein
MGFISEEEADARRDSGNNLLHRLGITPPPPVIDQVDIALEETKQTPTAPTEDDAIRLAVLAGRRHLKTSDQRGGRYPQQGNVPPIFRALIGSATALGTAAATAHAWGVNPTMAHHYKHGRTSQDKESKGLAEQIEDNTNAVRARVLDVLATTVSLITPDKLDNQGAKELSMIARNLSSIMSSTRPAEAPDRSTNAQVIVFSPEPEKEATYTTIEVG